MDGIRALARWRVAPSSSGAGIVDQSGVSMALFIINLPGCGWLPRNAAQVSCLRRDFKLKYYPYSVQLGYILTGQRGQIVGPNQCRLSWPFTHYHSTTTTMVQKRRFLHQSSTRAL